VRRVPGIIVKSGAGGLPGAEGGDTKWDRMMQRSNAPDERGRVLEPEMAGREATARELAEARRTAVRIFSAVASVIVAKILKVSIVGVLAVLAGVAVLVVVRVIANRALARRRDRWLDQARPDAGFPVAAEVDREPPSRSESASAWHGLAPVYGGLTGYFLAASGRTSSLEAFGVAMATVVALSLLINVAVRLTGRYRRPNAPRIPTRPRPWE
jgi:hypothetical protein